jgi:hypothetical protein
LKGRIKKIDRRKQGILLGERGRERQFWSHCFCSTAPSHVTDWQDGGNIKGRGGRIGYIYKATLL